MAWIEFHAAKVKRLQKFWDLRMSLSWSVNETLGFLGNLWGEIMELREDGDISNWKPEYLVELTGVKVSADKLWDTLVSNRWIDQRDGRWLVHDWLETAGSYLRGKYAKDNRVRLVEIWKLHGRDYGSPKGSPMESQQSSNRNLVVPNLTLPNPTIPTTLATKGGGKWDGAYHEFGDWVFREHMSLKPGDPDPKEKEAVSAAYRRYGRALRDIMAFAKGDPKAARKGLEAIGSRMEAMGMVWGLEAVARWFPDWAANPGAFDNETKQKSRKS